MVQKVQISDDVASQLYELAKIEHIPATELIEQLRIWQVLNSAEKKRMSDSFIDTNIVVYSLGQD